MIVEVYIRVGKVISGVNDLYTWCTKNGDRGIRIINEWCGADKDGKSVDIHSIASQSNKYVMWKCKFGHYWETKIQKRTLLASDCPYCAGSRPVVGENDFKTWCINNSKIDLIDEFCGYDKDDKPIKMEELLPKQHKKLKWKHCINGEEHFWIASVADRTVKNSGCPICRGRNNLVREKNDLKTWCLNNGEFGELLQQQWVGEDILGAKLQIDEISYGNSTKQAAWKCQCGKIWFSDVIHRTYNKSKVCPDCAVKIQQKSRYNKLLSTNGSFYDWCKDNGRFGQILLQQFMGIDEHGNRIDANNITCKQSTKVWWNHISNTGDIHSWLAQIHNRVSKEQNCPYCNNRQTSINEQVIYKAFKQIYPDTLNRHKINGLEYDVYIPSIKFCLEYDGEYYHTGRSDRDELKSKEAKSLGMTFIRVVQTRSLKDIELVSNDTIKGNFDSNRSNTYKLIKWLLGKVGNDLDFQTFNKLYTTTVLEMKES